MTDTLVERLTGQARAVDVGVELQVMLPMSALLDPRSPEPATLAGAGPLRAGLTAQILADSRGRKWWRRLFTAPAARGQQGELLVGGDPARRRFDGFLARLVTARDQSCRDPYCDAAIAHLDHIRRHSDGGPTTLANGRAVCARGNYVREMPGWRVELVADGLTGARHTTVTTTPTGHQYLSRAPQPP